MVVYKRKSFFDYLKIFFKSIFQVNQDIQFPNTYEEKRIFFKD